MSETPPAPPADYPVRTAGPEDWPAIRGVLLAAFGEAQGEEISCLVADLLRDPSARPLLSLVATDADRVVGHVLFTHARIEGSASGPSAAILAPLAVVPGYQGRGVGGALAGEGLARLRAAGVALAFVLGHPGYYPRFGFRPAGVRGYDAPYPIPPQHAQAWMVLALQRKTPAGAGGVVVCADSLMDPRHWLE